MKKFKTSEALDPSFCIFLVDKYGVEEAMKRLKKEKRELHHIQLKKFVGLVK